MPPETAPQPTGQAPTTPIPTGVLTPQQIQAARASVGMGGAPNIPDTSSAGQSQWAQFDTLVKGGSTDETAADGGDQNPGIVSRLETDTNAHAANIVEDLSQKPNAGGALDVVGNIAGEVGDFFGEPLKSAFGLLPQSVQSAVAAKVKGITGSAPVQGAMKDWNTFEAQHPDEAKALGNVFNIGSLLVGGGADDVAQPAIDTAKEEIGNTAKGLADNAATSAAEKSATAQDEFVKDLVTPEMAKKDAITALKTGKVTEGEGLTGERDITKAVPGFNKMTEAVKEVPGISAKNTALENLNAIHDHIGTIAEDLKTKLANDSTFKGFSPNQFKSVMNGVRKSLAENPMIVGDAEKTGSKIIDKFEGLVGEKGYTPNGLLDARKSLDQWMASQKGGAVFDPAKESAVSIALRGVRQGGNDFLAQLAPDVDVKGLLNKQSSLYDAIENIAPKAAKEGSTKWQQFVKAHPFAVHVGKEVIKGAGLVSAYEGAKAAGVPLP